MAKAIRTHGKVVQWGNSLALRLPQSIAIAAHLQVGTAVEMSFEAGHDFIAITPIRRPGPSLEERLSSFDATIHAGAWFPGAYEA